jgi:hypothetical protein
MPVADMFDASMAAVVRYLRSHGDLTVPHPPPGDIEIAMERGFVKRRIVDFHERASRTYTEPTTLGEHMLYHYPEGQRRTTA